MKTTNHTSKLASPAALLAAAALGLLPFFAGCTATENHVIATTATVIGVELSQSPTTTSPQAKLGYNRAEFAYVPTNRNVKKDESSATGAEQSADVIMELRYDGIFSNTGGIYQRLAVGSNAVKQRGAAYMFARDNKGEIKPETAAAIEKALDDGAVLDVDQNRRRDKLRQAYEKTKSDKPDSIGKFDEAVAPGFASFTAFLIGNPTAEQITVARTKLEADADIKKILSEIK